MRKLLLAATILAAMTGAVQAVTVDLGVNPNSATGDFSNDPGGGLFLDFYTFELVGGPNFIAFASATNDFAQTSDFIASFTGQLFEQVGAPGGGDDIPVSAAIAAEACSQQPLGCQILAGSALLGAGSYFLQLTGLAGGTAGYGGNLTTAQIGEVPIPAVGMALPGIIAGWAAYSAWRRRREQRKLVAAAA